MIATVLTCGPLLATVILLVFLHLRSTTIHTTAKDTSNVCHTSLCLDRDGPRGVLVYPPTHIFIIRTIYFETVDHSLIIFNELSIAECIWFMTCGTFSFVHAKCLITTVIVSTVSVEWLCEWLSTYWAKVIIFWLVYKVKCYCLLSVWL